MTSPPCGAIVDEVRAIRDEIAKEHHYDVHELFESFRQRERMTSQGSLLSLANGLEAAQPANAADAATRSG